MSTVGLNFGSPTSGQGFDVSATVSSIVSNLQKVETPWKNQLSSLQNQDTAISSLGTLLSALSSDLGKLTDFTGVLAQKTGSSSDTSILQLNSATSAAAAGTHSVAVGSLATTSSGYLSEVASASDALTGSIWLGVGNGTLHQVGVPSGGNLKSLASAINSAGIGISASVLTDSSGSRLSLVSGTSGADGNVVVGAATNLADAKGTMLGYAGTAGSGTSYSSGTLASVASATDTLTGSISIQVGGGKTQTVTLGSSGGTLQDLANAINNTAGIGATATISPDGKTLSLQSGTQGSAGTIVVKSKIVNTAATSLAYTSTVAGSDASLNVDGVNLSSASNIVSNLIPGVTFQLLSPSERDASGNPIPVQVVIGNDNSDVENTINSMVSDYNALIKAINAQEGNDSSGKPEPLFGSPTISMLQQQILSSVNLQNPNGFLDTVPTNTNTVLSGSITIQVGNGTAQTITLDSSQTSLGDLVDAINAANIGVSAEVVTNGTQSNLYLHSQTAGASGALEVSSAISATSDTLLSYSGSAGTATQKSTGTLTAVRDAGDVLSGSITIQVGSGNSSTITLDSTDNTIAGLAQAINDADLGVTASVLTDSDGSSSLSLLSETDGSAGTLKITSSVLDTTNTASTTLGYTNASDISGLTALGISMNNDGTISLDVSALDSTLNSDFNSVVGFFQSANSWGMAVANVLNHAGTESSMGILRLAQHANSTMESNLNAEIAKQDALIADQQKRLTAELNQANQILQALPSQLDGMDMIYSAISGYNRKS